MEPTKTRSAAAVGRRVGREEVFDVDAGGDFGDAGDVEEAAHFVGVGLGDGDDVAGGLADAALVVVHAIGLEFEVGAAQGVGRVLDVAAPDHGFDVVLEEDGVRQVGEVAGGREVIDDGAIEAFLADEIFEEGAHAGRIEALDGNRGGREEAADQFGIERGAGLGGNAVGEGIGLVRVFVGARGALGLGGIFDGDVVDFMPAMQVAQHLQGADLSALGGGVHEIGVDPEGLHTAGRAAAMTPSQRSSRLPVRNMSPQNWRVSRRQMRSVASSRPETWRCEQVVERGGIDVGGEQAVLGAHDLEEARGARIAQPLAERRGKAHFLAVDDFVRHEAFDGLLDDVLAFAVAQSSCAAGTRVENSTNS